MLKGRRIPQAFGAHCHHIDMPFQVQGSPDLLPGPVIRYHVNGLMLSRAISLEQETLAGAFFPSGRGKTNQRFGELQLGLEGRVD